MVVRSHGCKVADREKERERERYAGPPAQTPGPLLHRWKETERERGGQQSIAFKCKSCRSFLTALLDTGHTKHTNWRKVQDRRSQQCGGIHLSAARQHPKRDIAELDTLSKILEYFFSPIFIILHYSLFGCTAR